MTDKFVPGPSGTTSMREDLAALEHAQWAHWTLYMLENLTPENATRTPNPNCATSLR